jgi:peroxiredoxin family protein
VAPPDKLSIFVFSGAYDRVHYALATASAAAATNREVALFFTMGAVRALAAPEGETPGWTALLPAEDGTDAAGRDAGYAEHGIATFEELLSACVELGVGFRVCEMGLKAQDLALAGLRADVPLEVGGIVSFLGDASGAGAILFI